MGSLVAPIGEDGKLQTRSTSGDSLSSKSKKDNSTIDSDMFLSLLVAEMQNQDPLEPTSNTEWVSQYATFTQVQKMSEMAESVDLLRANDLVGKEVIMKVTSESTGDVSYARGTVDFITVENGKPIIWIDDKQYSMSDLDTVVSGDYSSAYDKYDTLTAMLKGLPNIKFADKSYENVIKGALKYYNTMNDYEKNFMATYGSDLLKSLSEWKEKLTKLGVDFSDVTPNEEEEEDPVTLDDIMKSFNTKMDAIIDKLNLLTNTEGDKDTEDDKDTEGDKDTE
jgi:Flagellar hook capping protein